MARGEAIDHSLDRGLHVVRPFAASYGGILRSIAKRRDGHAGSALDTSISPVVFQRRRRSSIDQSRLAGRAGRCSRLLTDQIDAPGARPARILVRADRELEWRAVWYAPTLHRPIRQGDSSPFLFGLNHARAASRSSGVPTSLQNPRISTARTTRPSAIICAIAPGISSSPRADGVSRAR